MADDIDITPGSGKKVATKDVGGRHFQRVLANLLLSGTPTDLSFGANTKANSVPVAFPTDQDLANLLATAASHKAIEVLPADEYVYINGVAYLVSRKKISENASGDRTQVSAVGGQKVRLLSDTITVASAVTLIWKDDTPTDLTGPLQLTAGIVEPFDRSGIVETAAGKALVLNLSASVQIGGHFKYVQYTP